jgi:hypothetical protein
VEIGTSLEGGEGWERIERLLALARSAPEPELSQERREQIRAALLDRLARMRERRLMTGAFVAGASTMVLAALLLKLVSGALPWVGRSSGELAAKPAVHRVVAE